MAKIQSPLLGYNNNVRHRGRLFHIQTEDSGVKHPHVITHLFMDGGRILKSVKKSYAEHVGSDGLSETVRVMMKEQHKAMFIALREGEFDHLVEGLKKPSGDVIAPKVDKATPASPSTPEAKADAPKVDAPKVDAPKIDPVKIDPPKVEAPKVDAPKVAEADAPKADAPKVDPVKIDPPKAPKVDAPKPVKIDRAPIYGSSSLDDVPSFLAELTHEPELAAMIAGGPATNPNPPVTIVMEDAPNTIAERPSALIAAAASAVEEEIEDSRRRAYDGPRTSSNEMAPPPPPSVRIAPPASQTNPSATFERAKTIAAMPGQQQPATAEARSNDDSPRTMRDPIRRRPSAEELTLDFDALERDSHLAEVSEAYFQTDLPPPPKNLFAKERGTGAYSAIEVEPVTAHSAPTTARSGPPPPSADPRAESSVGSGPPSKPRSSAGRHSQTSPRNEPSQHHGRYAPARPAAIFGSSRPARHEGSPPSASLFEEEPVGDKSLDEVILSYLAEDLDPPRRK